MGHISLREVLSTSYERAGVCKGHTDKALHVNLTNSQIHVKSTSNPLKKKSKQNSSGERAMTSG